MLRVVFPIATRAKAASLTSATVALLLLSSGAAPAVTSTWGGGTGNWDDATNWDTDPLYPCNGQGGNDYDVIFGGGTVTLNLDCTIDSFAQTSGTLNGAFDLTIQGAMTWTAGTHGGSGTTTLGGGIAVSGSANKFFEDTRTLVHAGGTGTWSLGSIFLGSGGATFRNETTWDLIGGTRAMSDTSDTGSFENTASGIVNVDLTDAARTLTISTGSVQNDGTLNANVGAIALNGDGTHGGSFAGAATVRFDGGTQTLGTGASVTVADLEVDAGVLNVDPGAGYAAANTDVTGGTLNVTDAGDTVTTATGTMTSGGIGGPGTLESTGSFAWTGGDMRGAGTTRVSGGLAVSGSANKFFEDTRTLVHAGGTGTWSLGSIFLGSGGATFRNETTWDLIGGTRAMSDTSDTGSFENTASGIVNVDLTDAARTLTISTGSVQNDGTINANVGAIALNGDGTHGGSFAGAATIRFAGGTQVLGSGSSVTAADVEVSGGTLDVDPAASYAAVNTDVTGGTLNVTNAGDTVTTATGTMTSGGIGGPGTFESTGSFAWTGGDMRGAGTTRVSGGLAVSGSANKFFEDTRTLVHAGGTGTWSLGSIFLGSGGATFRNETTWDLTGGTRAMSDTSDTGSFENTASGIVNVDLTDAARTLTISTGSVQNDGTINANVGAIALNGDGTHGGSFAGAATVRFDGGTQTLGTGASVTVADLEVDAGVLNVDPGAGYAAANTDVTGGTLNVTDAGDTVTTATGTMTSGGIGGPGTFESTGSFAWTGGDMRGAGTTRVSGGLAVSGSANKFFEDTRTLVHAGGTGTWSLGSIFLGSGGATFRNETTWDLIGGTRAMSDTSDTGSFENTATGVINVDLLDAARTITISTGSVANAGVIEIQQGKLDLPDAFVQTAGSMRLAGGNLKGPPLLDFDGGRLEGSGAIEGDITMAGTLAPGLSPGLSAGQLDIDGFLTLEPGSAFEVELLGTTRGSAYDSTTGTGSVTLDGTLSFDVLESFRAEVPDDSFIVLEQTGGSPVSGVFTNVANGERLFNSALDSVVVRYGPGSPTGANRVVLDQYVMYFNKSGLQISGTAAGGTLTMLIDGVTVFVVLTPGMTAAEVAAAIAAAVNANTTLHDMGIVAVSEGDKFFTNGLLTMKTVTDPGITLSSPFDVPALTGLGLVLISGMLAAVGLRARRRRQA